MRYCISLIRVLSGLAAAAAGDETTIELQWQRDCFRRTDQVAFERNETFAVEPDIQNPADIKRGVLKIGSDPAQEIGLLWDSSASKLYVDVNRDGDLTNDPNGVSSAVDSYTQEFKNLELAVENQTGIYRYQLELSLNKDGYYNWVHVLSGYSGSCELNGRKWTIQANDGLDMQFGSGDLLSILPQESKNRIWSASVPESVFIGERLYDLSFAFGKGKDGLARLSCTLKERNVATGTLQVKGQWINQLVLGDGSTLVLPELTDQPVTVPAGAFNVKQFALKLAEDKAVSVNRLDKRVSITEGQTSELAIGGPLKSSVDVSRQGRMLTFSYKLIGAGGEQYSPDEITNFDRSKPPTLAIYKGTTQLASGTFAYG